MYVCVFMVGKPMEAVHKSAVYVYNVVPLVYIYTRVNQTSLTDYDTI